MFWKLNPALQKYFNIEKYLNEAYEMNAERYKTYFISHSGKDIEDWEKMLRMDTTVKNHNHALLIFCQNPYSIDFLLKNPKFINLYIFSNEYFISNIMPTWKNRDSAFEYAIYKHFKMDLSMGICYSNLEEGCMRAIAKNKAVSIEMLCKFMNTTKEELKTLLIDYFSKMYYKQNKVDNVGSGGCGGGSAPPPTSTIDVENSTKEINSKLKLFFVNPNIHKFIYEMIDTGNHTEKTIISYGLLYNTNVWLVCNPDYYDMAIYAYNCCNTDKLDLDMNVPPTKLNLHLKRILKRLIHISLHINNTKIFDYIVKYWDDIFNNVFISNYYWSCILSTNINIMNYPKIIGKYKNNDTFLTCLCNNIYFIDYFKSELVNGIAEKMSELNWVSIMQCNPEMYNILNVYAEWLGCSFDEMIEKTPSIKNAFKTICEFPNHALKNIAWFMVDIDEIISYKKIYFEELMTNVWSPHRIQKLVDMNIDPDDF